MDIVAPTTDPSPMSVSDTVGDRLLVAETGRRVSPNAHCHATAGVARERRLGDDSPAAERPRRPRQRPGSAVDALPPCRARQGCASVVGGAPAAADAQGCTIADLPSMALDLVQASARESGQAVVAT